jgi:hypothetical protein
MRSSLSFTATNKTNRTDNDVPHMYYVYGKDKYGKTHSTTIRCTRTDANACAKEFAKRLGVIPQAITVKRA